MALRGFIPFGTVAVLSLRHNERQVIEPGAVTAMAETGVWLLRGYDYSDAIANTENGSLEVELLEDGIRWQTPFEPIRTDASRDAQRRVEAGLIQGTVPGMVVNRSTERDGIEVIEDADLCEINLVARKTGDGSRIETFRPRRRQR